MPKHSRKKFVRAGGQPGRLRLVPSDAALLSDLASYRFMNTEQIATLRHRGLRNLQRRLADLFHVGFVERPRQQLSTRLMSGHMVYGLGRKGAEFLFEGEAERREYLRRVRLDQETAFPYIAHALMISQFRSELALALEKAGGKATLSRWAQGYELKELLDRTGLVPDAFFSIDTPKGRLNFFLEADRSTMTRERVLAKMKTYWKWQQARAFEKKLGVSRFRVLTLTVSEERKENLRWMAKGADPLREGKRMFMFACEKQFSLSRPESVLAPVWLSPKDDEKLALVA
ncbi:MAG: replication-relaxation family protein [Patescibacteria group bacterium]|nr:replication-relaxation family protein [Patescibacteria group bacterium]